MFRIIENALTSQGLKDSKVPKFYGPYQSYEEAKNKEEELKIDKETGFRNGAFVGIQICADGVWFAHVSLSKYQSEIEYEVC